MKKLKIVIATTNDVPEADLNYAIETYGARLNGYSFIVESGKVLDISDFPYRATQFGKQYLADALLQAGLKSRKRGTASIVLTSADIYTRRTNYIFGLATYGSAVISSARIDPSFWKGFREIFSSSSKGRAFFEEQYAKVLLHELGHVVGLPHCHRWRCVMRYSNSPIELYKKGRDYCNECLNRLSSAIDRFVRGSPYAV